MHLSEDGFADVERSFLILKRCGEVTQIVVCGTEVAISCGHLRVMLTIEVFPSVQGFQVVFDGIGVIAHVVIDEAYVVKA